MDQWYPGHMKKGRRAIRENLSLVDVVLEVVDARIPYTGRNRDLNAMIGGKKRVLILNKRDLAQEEVSISWKDHYSPNFPVVLLDARKGEGRKRLLTLLNQSLLEGGGLHTPRLMIIGLPNVGKSLLINLLLGRKKVSVGARPGVTRGKQWIKVEDMFHLLDTPGILSPQIREGKGVFKLAVTGALPLQGLHEEEVALQLLEELRQENKRLLKERFNLTQVPEETLELFRALGVGRGFLRSKGRIDGHRTAVALLKEFLGGGLGRLTLEYPQELEDEGGKGG